jgi:hypothetical protein
MTNGFGKPKYGNQGFAKFFRLQAPKDGEVSTLIVRILPPIKSCAETGHWAKYHSVHYGYKGRDRKDQTKTRNRTFGCVEDRDGRTKIVRHECDACKQIERKETAMAQAEAKARVDGRTEEEIKSLLEPYKLWLKDFNVDRKWYLNVMTEKEEAGPLLISHRLKKQLDTLIDELMKKEGIDPLDVDNGLFFEFKRQGKGRETVDSVKVATVVSRNEAGKRVEEYKTSALSADLQKRLIDVCPDLNEVTVKLTDDQISRLVQCGNDPDVVDKIFDGSQPNIRPTTAVSTREPESQPKPAPVAKAAPAPATATEVVDDEEAALQRQLEAIKAKKAAAAAAATTVKAPTPTSTGTSDNVPDLGDVDPNDLDDEAFMNTFGAVTAPGT